MRQEVGGREDGHEVLQAPALLPRFISTNEYSVLGCRSVVSFRMGAPSTSTLCRCTGSAREGKEGAGSAFR